MNRCLISYCVAAPLLALAIPVCAQNTLPFVTAQMPATPAGQRNLPSHAQLGVLRISEVPNAQINGQAIRTAPGFRLFSADNKLIFAHSVYQKDLQVAYVKEASTNWLLTAWILSPQEKAALSPKR